jgi:tetratricopeptide (TPR) repeat protein
MRFLGSLLVCILPILLLLVIPMRATAPDDIIQVFNSSLTYESQDKSAEALQELEKAYPSAKSNYLVNLRMGWLHYSSQKYEFSEKYYRLALDLNKKSIEAMLGLTLPLAAQNKWDDVVKLYEAILEIDSDQYDANLRLGQILLNRGNYAQAQKHLGNVHLHYPGDYESNLSLGWANYYLGKKERAVECFTAALMLSPQDTSALRGMNLVK